MRRLGGVRKGLAAMVLAPAILLSAAPASAQTQEFPCIHAMYAPENGKYAQAARDNIAKFVPTLTAAIRAKFPDPYVLHYPNSFNENNLRVKGGVDWFELDRNYPSGTKFRDVQADALWPAYHADFLAALAADLGALDYRTVTPTCSRRYSPEVTVTGASTPKLTPLAPSH